MDYEDDFVDYPPAAGRDPGRRSGRAGSADCPDALADIPNWPRLVTVARQAANVCLKSSQEVPDTLIPCTGENVLCPFFCLPVSKWFGLFTHDAVRAELE